MTTKTTIALADLVEKGADSDLLRDMIQYVAQRLMEADAEGLCAAENSDKALGSASVIIGVRRRIVRGIKSSSKAIPIEGNGLKVHCEPVSGKKDESLVIVRCEVPQRTSDIAHVDGRVFVPGTMNEPHLVATGFSPLKAMPATAQALVKSGQGSL